LTEFATSSLISASVAA